MDVSGTDTNVIYSSGQKPESSSGEINSMVMLNATDETGKAWKVRVGEYMSSGSVFCGRLNSDRLKSFWLNSSHGSMRGKVDCLEAKKARSEIAICVACVKRKRGSDFADSRICIG